ncbi:MAG TPA: hypothetical protein VNX27_02940 [Chthoniobacterales bacterium]|jgi:hypothetical protein|nr:hypothetical protein [Chthoniobacterales bacterium]
MKLTLAVVVISFITLSGSLFAALGDTEEQVADLFGKPVNPGFPDAKGVTTNTYQKGNYMILVQFLKHLSLAESYTRVDKQELSNNEISALLDGNSNGQGWEKNPDKMQWERSDHKARAWLETLSGRPTLLVQAR